ncbi:5-oxoprolinase subunit B family protein [Tropicimonas sp.]|uniref:5-oxoprolinase subunit B family protein n=1 Tax=Tropicimonas sp. TaxID=2067044 RepID=UPI003A8655B0
MAERIVPIGTGALHDDQNSVFPRIAALGLDGLLVQFADTFSEPANRAVLAFRRALSDADFPGVLETAGSLASVHVRFDPAVLPHSELTRELSVMLAARDWYRAPLPAGRRLWRIPAAFGGEAGPQLARAAALAGVSEAEAAEQLSTARLRILATGFAPGQPYLGILPGTWNLPRQTSLQTRVPPGGIALAVRQMVLFPAASPTGWYHVARTAFRCFRAEAADPFPLKPGDEVMFPAVAVTEVGRLLADPAGEGGAEREDIR